MDYKELASTILEKVGGAKNVSHVTHCATRLRFNLYDDSKADTSGIESTNGVVGVANNGGQYQVIVGTDVNYIYKELVKLGKFDEDSIDSGNAKDNRSKMAKVIDIIAGTFTPIIPVLAGAGMLKAVIAIINGFNLLSPDSNVLQVLTFMGDAGFYFLPIILAASAAKKFQVNQYIAMGIGAILMHPSFMNIVSTVQENGESFYFIGLPVGLVNYSSTVIPIILAIWFMSYVEPFINKIIPKTIRVIIAPLFIIFIVATVTLIILGPLGNYLGVGLAYVFSFLNDEVTWLVPTLVGALTPLLVMVGMHYGLISIGINELATKGLDPVAGPGMLVSNIAQGGAGFAVALRAKNKELKALASSSSITALVGITEPLLYGVNLRYKRPLVAAMIGGGVGGLFLGIMGVGRFAQVPPGLLALPSYIGPDGFSVLIYAIIGIIISFTVSFIVSYFLGIKEEPEQTTKDTDKETIEKKAVAEDIVYAPITGKSVELKEVDDGVFSQGILGQGVAIIPEEGKVFAPIDGTVSVLLDSHHAIGITGDGGAEILIHVGIDTVQLDGLHYSPKVEQGQRIKKGDLILEFDLEAIKKEGYPVITPIIVTNSSDFADVLGITRKSVKSGDALIKLP
ncbi:beta-glucoside-specific PTS transporter subunit IIABC [Oceanobacillus neutriphilus]|uniref:PTS beta-glucoside transporter subunit EIIBCA n=1 Tax=Oceanobacillus neutriphilus TaxID=531815 RepID=A0ABQ2NR78_9BACI|nr:beta-glucoside-specific PTS transporter subunit IIABC [Oceanobacillus neutriphilus]GGP08452.1 PTS beta-glucoside transporter subunit EIIBCA [Oceanobacillus neutriphilus]